ncbi:MAG TPA: histidine kinase [Agrobacterium sp.]|uniref:sensor histidine kinase n=1 Tax=Agrobacterium pusense TaxID=648995 RepID=UPI000E9CF356|nr:histidine kinase [Agrobacterium pusense]MDH0871347.1 histidine kinase [Agrobacterium pusense]HAU77969.1 histidine kinase [Agrobacterium sp.]
MNKTFVRPPGAVPSQRLGNRLLGAIADLSIANQFLLAASIVVFGLMAVLSFFTASQVERSALDAAGVAGAATMQTAIAPLLRRDGQGNFIFDERFSRDMLGLIGQGPQDERIINVKIWLADGTPVFSANEETSSQPEIFPELAGALAGETMVSRTKVDKHEYSAGEKEELLLEIYAPLYADSSGKVLLAGEIYQESVKLQRQISHARTLTMTVVFLLSVPMLSLLYLIVHRSSRLIDEQRKVLRQSLRNAIDLSIENDRLRVIANNARQDAGKLNERIVDQIGADLHDGSVQVLTLVKLRMSDMIATEDAQSSRRDALQKILNLVSSVLEELRNISAGLVLPELAGVTIQQAIELSTKRFFEITGSEVEVLRGNNMDIRLHDLSICLYRFVLEGLMNSYRHAHGNRQVVRYRFINGRLHVSVADFGSSPVLTSSKDVQRARLGQISQKRRVSAFGGKMRFFPRCNGSIAIAVLPITTD